MKKYIDVSNEIKDKFKTGIQILDDVSNDIQEFLTLLQSSSGETIELIRNDLTFLKDKYTTIKEKVEKRSMEIEERANTYDEWLKPWIKMCEEKKAETRTVYENGIEYREKLYIDEVQGPDSDYGLGVYIYKIYKYEVGEDGKETLKDIVFSVPNYVFAMWAFEGDFWNASDYAMSSIAFGVSQLSKLAPTDTQDSSSTESDGPIEYNTQERMDAAISKAKEYLNIDWNYYTYIPRYVKEVLEADGYTEQEILYALDNVGIDWKERALKYGQLERDDGWSYNTTWSLLRMAGYKQSEIDYAIKDWPSEIKDIYEGLYGDYY